MNKIIIEKDKLEHNIKIIKDKIKDLEHKPTIIAVLKGNAYGLDSVLIAKKLIDYSIDFFAVSEISEARKLRENGFDNNILLLESTCIEREAEEIVSLNLIATIGSLEALKVLNKKAKEINKTVYAHLKVDTGFGRFGFIINEEIAKQIAEVLIECDNVKITGTYSHFSESYSNKSESTERQFAIFNNAVKLLNDNNIDTGMLHICNSSAFFKYQNMYLDAVRLGSAFTGRIQINEPTGLQRVGHLESEICEIRNLSKGSKIGYSGTYTLKRDSRIAIVEVGYEAGIGVTGPKDAVRFIDKMRALKLSLSKFFSNERIYVEVNGQKCPILGRIGMKNTIIDITDIEAKAGDIVKFQIGIIFANSNIKRQEQYLNNTIK